MTPQDIIDMPKTFRIWLLRVFQSTEDTESQFAFRCHTDITTLYRIWDGKSITTRSMVKITTAVCQSLAIPIAMPLTLPAKKIKVPYAGVGSKRISKYRWK